MSLKRANQPPNLRALMKRIDNLAHGTGRPVRRIQRAVANTVVGQMLPPSVVKGGTAMKLRIGEARSRFTPDFDASRSDTITLDDYLDQLGELLAEGWSRFTGTVVVLDSPQPEGAPNEYVMRPFEIKLAYSSQHWLTVAFELGRDEIGSTKTQDFRVAPDIVEMFEILGLDTPAPIPVLAVDHRGVICAEQTLVGNGLDVVIARREHLGQPYVEVLVELDLHPATAGYSSRASSAP